MFTHSSFFYILFYSLFLRSFYSFSLYLFQFLQKLWDVIFKLHWVWCVFFFFLLMFVHLMLFSRKMPCANAWHAMSWHRHHKFCCCNDTKRQNQTNGQRCSDVKKRAHCKKGLKKWEIPSCNWIEVPNDRHTRKDLRIYAVHIAKQATQTFFIVSWLYIYVENKLGKWGKEDERGLGWCTAH